MKFHSYKKVVLARSLRKKGVSSKIIADKLGVSDTTILRWCDDISSQNFYHLSQDKKHKQFQEIGAKILNDLNINVNTAKIYCSLLYWCEGTRHPQSNAVVFSNSNTELIRSFLQLFRKGFVPKEEKFRIHLQLHSSHDKTKILDFWSNLLKIPKSQFYKPTITKAGNRMKRQNYIGTCSVRYHDFKIFHQIKGMYENLPVFIDKTTDKK